MALGKHSNTIGGIFGGHSSGQSGGYNNQSQQIQDLSQQTTGGYGYYANSATLQQQQDYSNDPTQALYNDPTAGQNSFSDPNFSNQQLYMDPSYNTPAYTDPSYNTQASTDPSYDTTGQSYAPIDQSYGSGQTYDDSVVDAPYTTDTQEANDEWEAYNMNTVEEGSEQVADTIADGGEGVLDVMDA
jgi:hypothetical protein